MSWIARQWESRSLGALALLPLAAVFGAVAALRRALYRSGVLSVTRLPVPVIVVGNIMVGGTGKTPLVVWLCDWLQAQGRHPGVVTRGYGGSSRQPSPVAADADPLDYGDEAVLLAGRTSCPVWSGPRRAECALALLARHPGCDVIVSDDGLQHYALARDVEIAVIDGARGHGNKFLLPAGPLREPPSRLRGTDAIVVNGERIADAGIEGPPAFAMRLEGRSFRNLRDPQRVVGPEYFRDRKVHAVAGIGHPDRFFRHLRALGLAVTGHAFPDHHAFRAADLVFDGADAVVMTEKDAVKCRRFANESCWVLPVAAEVDPALGTLLNGKLEKR